LNFHDEASAVDRAILLPNCRSPAKLRQLRMFASIAQERVPFTEKPAYRLHKTSKESALGILFPIFCLIAFC
jgi:hypothetical protein